MRRLSAEQAARNGRFDKRGRPVAYPRREGILHNALPVGGKAKLEGTTSAVFNAAT